MITPGKCTIQKIYGQRMPERYKYKILKNEFTLYILDDKYTG